MSYTCLCTDSAVLIVKLKSGKSVSSAWHGNLTKPGFAQFSSLYEVCALEAEKKKEGVCDLPNSVGLENT